MAVAFEGFSIREYASRMRGENAAKSWPFAGDVDVKQIESTLPPITVTKFRWWLDELKAARQLQAEGDAGDAETLEVTPLGYPLCSGLKAPSISSTLTVQTGNCLSSEKMKRKAKSNSKAPKKRSIVEIFAVAPQIEKAASELNSSRIGESSGRRNSNSISSKKKKRKNKKKRNLLDKTLRLPVDTTKIKKKKTTARKMKNHQDAFIAFEQENATKLEGKTASIRTRNFFSSCEGRYGSTCRKKPRFKSSSSHEKHAAIVPSGFRKKQNKPVVPVCGILKKQRKFVFGDSDSQEALHSEKHVKFLDDVEVQGGWRSSSIQQSDVLARCAGVDKLIGGNEKPVIIDLTEEDDEGPGSGNPAQVPVQKEHLTDTREGGNAENSSSPELAGLRSCKKSQLTESSSTSQVSNHHQDMDTFTKGKTVVIDDSTNAENLRFLTCTNIPMPGSSARVSGSSGSYPGQILIQPCSAEDGLRLNSIHVEPASRPRDLDLFPVHNCEPRSPGADVLCQNPEIPVTPSRLLNTDLNLVKAITPREEEDRASPSATPLTLRLMGKDVSVVRSTNTRGLEDGNIWTGKEMTIEHHHRNDQFTLPGLQKSKGPVNLPLEPCKNLQYKSPVTASKSLLLSPYINWGTDQVPQRDRFTFTRSLNPGEQSHSPVGFDFTGFEEPLVVRPRPGLPSLPRGSSRLIHQVPETHYRPNPPRPRASGFDICFLRHDFGEHFQQGSLCRKPFKDLPARPLHSSDWERSTTTAYSVPCPNEIHRNHLSQTPPRRFNSPGNFTTYGSILTNSFCPSPAVRPQLLDTVPGIEQASIKNISYRNGIKSIDTVESPAFGVRTPDLFANTRKRPAVNPLDSPMI